MRNSPEKKQKEPAISGSKLRRVLVANRGEIAVRIIRAAREYGLETVAVYSDADSGAQHVRLADHRIALGGNTARETYLNQQKLLDAAIQSRCDAVHPGYGFFAENAGFAEAVGKARMQLVGPSPEVIRLMGDKDRARKRAVECGVPVVPGTDPGLPLEELKARAQAIGYPVMIKAVAGGSGRGMRLVEAENELEGKLHEAQGEAESAFANRDVIIEKYVVRPRHIEVQVFGDTQGNVVHFGERECSLQRRHQKVLEEAPAARFHPKLRERMCSSAVELARSVGYVGAGTVEFLVSGGESENDPFYFLEMNTRIQVEHPVTELVTGVDLVKLQFAVAEGRPLPMRQKDIRFQGHALELRIYAEDTAQGFKPVTGKVLYIQRPGGPGVREDTWVEAGTRISAFYDSLLSKLSIWGSTRAEAIERARRATAELVIEGLETTLGFQRWVLSNEDFQNARVDVGWIERVYRGEKPAGRNVGPLELPPLPEELARG